MKISIEDFMEDIISKAQRGLNLGNQELSKISGLSLDQIKSLKRGEFNEDSVIAVADKLSLHTESLITSGMKSWHPELETPDGLKQFSTPFGDGMFVNAYLVWDINTKEAVVFDTGTDSGGILDAISNLSLQLKSIFITHTHPDHVYDIERLVKQGKAEKVYAPEKEMIADASPVSEGDEFKCGSLSIRATETSGHSAGGTSYLLKGLSKPLAITGDAVFAGSIGGVPTGSYQSALQQIRDKIFTLPDETIICPGHGPLSTIEEEKKHNPFFPEYK